MNWDAIAAVAEMLAALGVIVSLVYVALQVRQNTRQLRLNLESLGMTHEMGGAQMASQIALTMATDVDLSGLVRRAMDGSTDLSPADRLRWGSYLYSVLTVHQAGYHNYRRGFAQSDTWRGHQQHLVTVLDNPGARAWWLRTRSVFSADFVEYVEDLLGFDTGVTLLDAAHEVDGA